MLLWTINRNVLELLCPHFAATSVKRKKTSYGLGTSLKRKELLTLESTINLSMPTSNALSWVYFLKMTVLEFSNRLV